MKKRSYLISMIIISVSLGIVITFSMQGCDEDKEEYDVKFYWTPAQTMDQQGPFVETYTFHCLDISTPGCNVFSFQDAPHDSGNWMSYPADKGACANFIAVVNGPGGAVFTFIGTLVTPESEGGIKAIGTYDKEEGGLTIEIGTFIATSDKISGDDSPECK